MNDNLYKLFKMIKQLFCHHHRFTNPVFILEGGVLRSEQVCRYCGYKQTIYEK